MPYYESVFIARQDISQTQVDTLTDQFRNIVIEGGGQVTKTEYWGVRNLAYRIKKNRKAHYVLMNLDAPSAAIQEMERNMRISEDVLRYLTTKTPVLEEEPSVIMRSRRDDRGGRMGRDDRGGRMGRDDRGGRMNRDDRGESRDAAFGAPFGSGGQSRR